MGTQGICESTRAGPARSRTLSELFLLRKYEEPAADTAASTTGISDLSYTEICANLRMNQGSAGAVPIGDGVGVWIGTKSSRGASEYNISSERIGAVG